jgi:hypothetical protein
VQNAFCPKYRMKHFVTDKISAQVSSFSQGQQLNNCWADILTACRYSTSCPQLAPAGNTKGGSITVPLTSCLTGSELAVWQLTIFCFYLQNRLIQTIETGGQWYSGTSPFCIPWPRQYLCLRFRRHESQVPHAVHHRQAADAAVFCPVSSGTIFIKLFWPFSTMTVP